MKSNITLSVSILYNTTQTHLGLPSLVRAAFSDSETDVTSLDGMLTLASVQIARTLSIRLSISAIFFVLAANCSVNLLSSWAHSSDMSSESLIDALIVCWWVRSQTKRERSCLYGNPVCEWIYIGGSIGCMREWRMADCGETVRDAHRRWRPLFGSVSGITLVWTVRIRTHYWRRN